jgi:hypothetical protein
VSNPQEAHLKDFAKLIGSKKGTDPIPPDQYRTYQHKRYPEDLRVWSYLMECSIAPGHRKGPATTAHGRKLTPTDIMRALKMNKGGVNRALRRLEQEGRMRRGEEGSLWISGDFTLLDILEVKPSTDSYPTYYINQINKLPKSVQEAFVKKDTEERELRNAFLADLKAASDLIFDTKQNNRYAAYGVKRIRETHKARDGKEAIKAARDRRVLALLPSLEKAVERLESENHVQSVFGSVHAFDLQTENAPEPAQATASVIRPVTCFSETEKKTRSVAIPSLVDNAAEAVQPVPIPALVETPDALDSVSKREIRTAQTGPHVSFENKSQERADTEAIVRVSAKSESEKTQCQQTKKRKHA